MAAVALLACVLLVVGCGRGDRLETAEVAGTVTLDGEPVTQGTVLFTPEQGRVAKGEIRPDGSFSLGTYEDDDGAIVGKHQVTVVSLDRSGLPDGRDEMADDSGPKWLIPRRYGNPAASGLTFQVEPDMANVAELKLSSQPAP